LHIFRVRKLSIEFEEDTYTLCSRIFQSGGRVVAR